MLTKNIAYFLTQSMHIYVTANLRNQIFPGIIREYHQIFPNLSWNNWRSISEIPGNLYAFLGFPGFSKRVRDTGEHLVPHIRSNIYRYVLRWYELEMLMLLKPCPSQVCTQVTNILRRCVFRYELELHIFLKP